MGARLTKAMHSCCFAMMLFVANSMLAAQATHSPTAAMSAPNSNHSHRPAKWTAEQRALHALNRLTFGPRPGDLVFFDTYGGAIIAIPVLRSWNVELELVVSRVGLLLAKIPFKPWTKL